MKRFYSLDILKFGAAILIIFHHFQQSFDVKYSGINFFGGEIYFGYVVELFFMLSGFFMAMGAARYAKESFSSFMGKRAIRLFPMAWITVTVHAIIIVLYKYTTGKALASFGIWKYLVSMGLLSDAGVFEYKGKAFNNPLWYLGVLLICYALFWLLTTSSLKERTGNAPIYIFMVLLGLGVDNYEMSVPFFNPSLARGVIPFFAGCILFIIYEKARRLPAAIVSFVLLAAAVAAYRISSEDFYDDLRMILLFLIYPALTILFLDSAVVNKIFNHKFFGELGKISFEMYIWHVPCFSFVKLLAAHKLVSMPSAFSDMLLLTLVITILAAVMHYALEKPLTKRLMSRFFSAPAA